MARTGLGFGGFTSDPLGGVFANVQGNRVIIQDYVPLADSIEWQLGQRYLQERGSQAFLGDARPVPYVINNDGTRSRHAAQVLFASLVATERAGPLEPDLFVLELGRARCGPSSSTTYSIACPPPFSTWATARCGNSASAPVWPVASTWPSTPT